MSKIHSTAIIEDGAVLAENVEVGPYAFISSQAVIGEGTKIGHAAGIHGKTTIGKNNTIFSHAVVGSMPQDLKFKGEEVELIIGDNNLIREFTLINPGTEGGGSITRIGDNNLLMGYVHVAHDCIIGNHCILANGATLAGHVVLEDNVFVGGLTPVHQFVTIGTGAIAAGASAISQDIPPYCLAEGNRAVLRGLNLNGLRRRVNRDDINALKIAYRTLFTSGKPMREEASRLLEETTNNYVKNLCEFVIQTKRGIPLARKEENNENENM